MLRSFCRGLTGARQFSASMQRLVIVEQHGGGRTQPKEITFKEAEDRVLTAIKKWDRFPQDRIRKLSIDSDLFTDLGLDSLDHVEIMISIEDEFALEVADADTDRLRTPRDIHKYICEKLDVYK